MALKPALVQFGAAQSVRRVAQEPAIDFASGQGQREQSEQHEKVAEKQAGPTRRAWARPQMPRKEREQPGA